MSKEKKPFYLYIRFWVMLYALVVALFITSQLIAGLLVVHNVDVLWINNNFVKSMEITLETAAWFWTALVSAYCMSDKYLDIRKTMNLTAGQMSVGDMAKLRKIIIISLLLSIYSVGCTLLVDLNFQMEAFFSSFGLAIIFYSSGHKLVESFKYYPGKVDGDADGIPDVIQHKYEKWVRSKRSSGVKDEFISLEYYFDEFPEDKKIVDNALKNPEVFLKN